MSRDHMPKPIRYADGVAYIPLTQGLEAVVDLADAHLVEGRRSGVENGK